MMHRAMLLSLLLGLAGCSGSPADLGITGPGQAPASQPTPQGDDVFDTPAFSLPGTGYGPAYTPGSGNGGGKFFNYN